MCYYRDGRTRSEARLCRDQDTEDGSTGVGGGALADLATLSSCWLAIFFIFIFPCFCRWSTTSKAVSWETTSPSPTFQVWPLEKYRRFRSQKWKKILLHNSLRTYPLALDGTLGIQSFQFSPVSIAAFPWQIFERYLWNGWTSHMFWTWISCPNEIPMPDPTAFFLWPPREQYPLLSQSLSGF